MGFLLQQMFAALNSMCIIAYGGVTVDLLRNLFCCMKYVIKLTRNVCEYGQSNYLKMSKSKYKQIVILNKQVSIYSLNLQPPTFK